MTPLAIRIQNFRSFKKEQSFSFPARPGLYFMQGINEVDEALGGNGAGKTSIWEALTWCLHGVTTEGLKAGDVCNWDQDKGVLVAFDFCFGDEQCIWTVTRTWGPISWKLSHVAEFITDEQDVDLTKDPSNPVLAALRLELDPWLNCVLMAQGQPMFLDLKADAQASLFSSVLGLERWVDYAKRASVKAGAQDAVSRELEREQARLKGELEGLGRQDFSKSQEDWERNRERMLDDLAAEHKEGVAKLKRLEGVLEEAREAEKNARAWVARAQPEGALLKDAGRMRGNVADYSTMKRDAERDLAAVKGSGNEMEKEEACPTCQRPFTKEHLREHRAKIGRAVIHLENQVARWDKELRASQERLTELEEELGKQEEGLGRARDALDHAQRDASNARRAVELQERELDGLEDRAEALEAEENPFAKMARQATRNASRLREELGDVQARLDASNARYGLLSYWSSRGFKELRLQQIAEALTELEIEVNSAVTALGLVDWELRFAVDKEGKGGGLQRGFSVTVKSPHQPRATPWRAWSGGEKQRLRLAANMGLADLIRGRTGTGLNLEVWDEPTNGLSPQGWRDLLESLKARAEREKRLIFITDHKAHDFGGFAGSATVYKRPSGSKIVTTWGKV